MEQRRLVQINIRKKGLVPVRRLRTGTLFFLQQHLQLVPAEQIHCDQNAPFWLEFWAKQFGGWGVFRSIFKFKKEHRAISARKRTSFLFFFFLFSMVIDKYTNYKRTKQNHRLLVKCKRMEVVMPSKPFPQHKK